MPLPILGKTILYAFSAILAVGPTLLPPDPNTGNVKGQIAVMFWPEEALGLESCQAHLVPIAEKNVELTYACGEWFLPPKGGYKVWMESTDAISPAPFVMRYRGGVFAGKGMLAVAPLVPAGEVALRRPSPRKGTSLRMINVDSFKGPALHPAFDRRADPSRVTNIHMPVGRVLAGLFDDRTNDCIALARPVVVQPRKLQYIEPQAPSTGADIFLVLERPRPRTVATQDIVTVLLDVPGRGSLEPAISADTADRIVAAWYGVDARAASLRVQSDVFSFSQDVRLNAKEVVTVRDTLRLRPKLHVTVVVPDGVNVPEMRLKASRRSGEIVRETPVRDNRGTLDDLPTEELDVQLTASSFNVRQPVDLRPGQDEDMTFVVKLLHVSGTVYRGDKPTAADLTFATQESAVQAPADERGRYSATLFVPGYYQVQVSGSGIPRHTVRVTRIDADRTLDLVLPSTTCEIHVRNRASGEAVPDIRALVLVTYSENGQVATQRETGATDANGVIALPPVHPGMARITISDSGKFAGTEISQPIRDTTEVQVIDVALDEARDRLRVQLTLPEPAGAPAIAADAIVVDRSSTNTLRSQLRADASGVLSLPSSLDANLMVRHASAGVLVAQTSTLTDGATIQLPPLAPPLLLACQSADGAPAARVEVGLRINNVRLVGIAANFASGGMPLTRSDGTWVATGLPNSTIGVLAFDRRLEGQVAVGAYDNIFVPIQFPWPTKTKITSLQ